MYYTTFIKNIQTNYPDYDSISQNYTSQNTTTQKITLNLTPRTLQQLSFKQIGHIKQVQIELENCYNILKPFEDTHDNAYYTFQIPKHSGGLRTINAPLPAFNDALTRVNHIFTNNIRCLPHNAAYAYVKQRSIKDANIKHQQNNSNWFLHLDLNNFFPNCTHQLVFNTLLEIYPFHYLSDYHKNILSKIIQICCLNGALPQGSPMSPLLSNLVCIPIDYKIQQFFNNNPFKTKFVYTRYADDFTISSKNTFNFNKLVEELSKLIYPFQFKPTKTHYGSRAGSNWNLGLMLNKDNNITIGHIKKKNYNAMLNNFLKDFSNNILWSAHDTQTLQGRLSFLNQIEPDYFDYIIQKYNKKYNTNYSLALKTILG